MTDYKFPNSIEEFKSGDIYQVKYPLVDIWTENKTYAEGCKGLQEDLQYLIERKRVRIILT